eukprot:Gb_32683 [translate_table: standard]
MYWKLFHQNVNLSSNVGQGTENVRGLSLVFGGSVIWNRDRFGRPCAWPADAFANMKELKLLELGDDCVEGDLGKLRQELVWLRWRNYPYECMPPNLRLNHARVLDFCGGELVSLWDDESQVPLKLQELNLQRCYKLQRVPDSIGRLRGLQKLDISECLLLKILSEEISYLESLEVLSLESCLNLEYLPSGFGGSFGSISTLKQVNLLSCRKLETFPTQPTRQRSLKKLGVATVDEYSGGIADFGHNDIPENFGELSRLTEVEMGNLTRLPQSIGKLSQPNLISPSLQFTFTASAIPYPTAWLDCYHFQMMSKRDTMPFVSGSSGFKCSLPAATNKKCAAIIICFVSVLQLIDELNDNQLRAPPRAQLCFELKDTAGNSILHKGQDFPHS